MSIVRTRFAPSPTGFLHVGGIRSALFAWLLARHHKGQFLLRIEDTDRERLVPGSIQAILEDFAALGIDIDEGPSAAELKACDPGWENPPNIGGPYGPYVQSLRCDLYKAAAEKLVAGGFAYRCDCTPEMIERERLEQMARREKPGYSGYCRDRNVSVNTPHIIRLRLPVNFSVTLEDAVKGRLVWENPSLRDPVILKSDGFPTYHLAAIVDDNAMQISHVIRGDEWLATTPLHLQIYDCLGWPRPIFAHLPPVLGEDGKKLSKRTGAQRASELIDAGYMPEAVLNFLALIGWNPGEGEEQEIFSRDDLISRFTLDRVSSAGGIFSEKKLEWMNGIYIRMLSTTDLLKRITPFVEASGGKVNVERLEKIAPHIQERMRHLKEAAELTQFLFQDQIVRDLPAMFQKDIDSAKAIIILNESHAALSALDDFTVTAIEGALRAVAEKLSLKPGPMFGVVRIAVTGKKVTPPLFESIFALGRETTLARLVESKEELSQT